MFAESIDISPAAIDAAPGATVPQWRTATRIAFRFCFAYFGLYVLCTQMLGGLLVLPVGSVPQFGRIPPMLSFTSWVATHVFGVTQALVITGSGSGDKTFDWVQAFCLLVIAFVATTLWSLIDRRRDQYITLHKWFRLFLRFALGSTMVGYGMAKAIPMQMPAPSLARLLEPFGNFSPMGVLWASIGASRPYEMFTGFAELTAGVLLFVPRLATLGALVCLADVIEIFALNMTYDVPVKLFSFHLILMSLVLLAPDASRLANVLVFDRTAGPSTQPPLVRSRRGMRIALIVQLVFGTYLLGMSLYSGAQRWKQFGGGAPKSPLYGIWNVDEMSIDGTIRAPLLTDSDRWRRVVFQAPAAASFHRMDDTFITYTGKIDMNSRNLSLAGANGGATFAFEQPSADRLILNADINGRAVRMQLRLVDRDSFLLVNRGFHWVQEYPFNR